jgi:hypothetical protein
MNHNFQQARHHKARRGWARLGVVKQGKAFLSKAKRG